MSKIYTTTGDSGTTSLVGGTRISKADARLEAYGTIDELNSHIGLVTAAAADDAPHMLQTVQNLLFNIGGWLATPSDSPYFTPEAPGIDSKTIADLEAEIDAIDSSLAPLKAFILPGGCLPAAHTHVARTVCRRAERQVVALREHGIEVPNNILRYLNRLSDYLFVLARFLNHTNGVKEPKWQQN